MEKATYELIISMRPGQSKRDCINRRAPADSKRVKAMVMSSGTMEFGIFESLSKTPETAGLSPRCTDSSRHLSACIASSDLTKTYAVSVEQLLSSASSKQKQKSL